jgi:hypothetical protein
MKYEQLEDLGAEEFRRLTGVKSTTFRRMCEILKEADTKKKAAGGRKNKLSLEDRLLMALEYIREYRTYFHISVSYGLSESVAYRTIRWVEDTLIKHKDFALPGRKAIAKPDTLYEAILVDATESPIARPKKNNGTSILARSEDTL